MTMCLFFFFAAEDHCHRERNEAIDKKARKKLIIACILCVIFMIAEAVGKKRKKNVNWLIIFFILTLKFFFSLGGFLSNSLAVATDAAHLLTDFASFLISLFSIWVASRPATRKMPFGWYRAEVSKKKELISYLMILENNYILWLFFFVLFLLGDWSSYVCSSHLGCNWDFSLLCNW